MVAVLEEFMTILVGGIADLAEGVASGVVTMCTKLFLKTGTDGAVTGLSVFGGVTAIFAGISLAIGITTLVFNWVSSLGN